MKKLLLILALLAYVAISCDDKPKTLTGGDDEPSTEQPGDKPADSTGSPNDTIITTDTINTENDTIFVYSSFMVAGFVYNVSSDDIDFDASVNSIFKHYRITLKDGTMPEWIGTNLGFTEQSSLDSGSIITSSALVLDSLKHGNYCVISWDTWGHSNCWGPNYHDTEFKGFYHDITLNERHIRENVYVDTIRQLLDSVTNLSFTKY